MGEIFQRSACAVLAIGGICLMRVVSVYVGAASQTNLKVGLDRGIWGFKKDWPEYAEIEPGDVLVAASGFSGGSPRTSEAGWLAASVSSIEVARITSKRHHDASAVWPDEDGEISYPCRFTFERIGTFGTTRLGADGPVGDAVSLGFRNSSMVQGRGNVHEDPAGFDVDHFLGAAVDSGAPDPAQVTTPIATATIQVSDLLRAFRVELDRAGLSFPEHLAVRFLCGLLAKPFVILAGLSGSGKTQLAAALGRWLGPDRAYVAAVRPDWTGSEALFGYENLLVAPSADGRAAWSVPPVLEFLLSAAADPEEPYLLVLDEMNLAHVERYFADALSGMESGSAVIPNLSKDCADGVWRPAVEGPARLAWPSNLLVVGTVNVDETTYQFSSKVLDRSTTIEFRTETAALAGEPPKPDLIEVAPSEARRRLVDRFDDLTTVVSDSLDKQIQELHAELAEHGREFGHRTYQEMRRYAAIAGATASLDDDEILDHLVLQKVLPRINGSARELKAVIAALATFTLGAEVDGATAALATPDGESTPRLPLSAEKLGRMSAELDATHFTSF